MSNIISAVSLKNVIDPAIICKSPFTGSVLSLLSGSSIEPTPTVPNSNLDDLSSVKSTLDASPISKDGDFSHITNEEFISAVFSKLPDGAHVAVCSKAGDPTEGGWFAKRADTTNLPVTNNNYFTNSSFFPLEDETFKVRKAQVAACNGIMLDDLGSKISVDSLGGFKPSWLLETSPGNFQAGFIFKEPITDGEIVEQLSKAIIDKGLSDPGASGPATRWSRLPKGSNGKNKYRDAQGKPFHCRLVQWRPDKRYTPQEIIDGLKLELQPEKEAAVEKYQENEGDDALTPRSVDTRGLYKHDTSSDDTILLKTETLLKFIDPDCSYRDWLYAAMAVFHETKGSDEGLAMFDRWSSKGTKYKGIKEIEAMWRSFRLDEPNPVTIGTLIKMARDAGADVSAIIGSDGFKPCEYEVVNPSAFEPEKIIVNQNQLDKYSLLGMSDEIEKQVMEEIYVLDEIALLGQATVIYAAPNTGKTLVTMKLVIQSIKQGQVDPKKVYYINVDDTAKGLLGKLRIFEEYGCHMLSEGYREFKVSEFLATIESMIESGNTQGVIIILDTLKKFTDLMDKRISSHFGKIMRKFVMKGGTVIGLAHTNKNKGLNGKPVHAGTSDIMEDFDCAYILDTVSEDASKKVVEFTNTKKRGNVALSVSYSYALERDIPYNELLLSVEKVNDTELTPLKHAAEVLSDAEVITAIESCINEGINTKMKLSGAVAERAKVSQRSAHKIIEKYTGDDPAIHKWSFVVGGRGAKSFMLLECPSAPIPDITSL